MNVAQDSNRLTRGQTSGAKGSRGRIRPIARLDRERVALQIRDRHQPQGGFVGGGQIDRRRNPGFQGLLPTAGTQTPAIARFQPGKVRPGKRRAEVIAPRSGKGEKFSRNLRTNRMGTPIERPRFAITGAMETGHWLASTNLQRPTQHVSSRRRGAIARGNLGIIDVRNTVGIHGVISGRFRHITQTCHLGK